uniref:C2H2-type domain-containing protein n=2 Tax=Caenorhabditis tropicalis TaxID=1561998 RepID=A0A1I7UR72_9PELO
MHLENIPIKLEEETKVHSPSSTEEEGYGSGDDKEMMLEVDTIGSCGGGGVGMKNGAELKRPDLKGSDSLRTHMFKQHHISRMYMCRCCNWAFPDKSLLHIHLQSNNNHPMDLMPHSVINRSCHVEPFQCRESLDYRSRLSNAVSIERIFSKNKTHGLSYFQKELYPAPSQSAYVPLKLDKSSDNVAAKKSRANNRTSAESIKSPDKKSQKVAPQPKKKSFFKNMLDKTRSWMRKSDDVAQPTKEMLFKSYVNPEYGIPNSNDFHPDPTNFLGLDLDPRLKNARCGATEVFINNRPFWVHRTNEDVIPKSKLLAHNALVAQHALNNACFLKELPRKTFFDPKKETLERLMAVDKVFGLDESTKGWKRVTANTFMGTCQMHAFKNTVEGKRRLEEFEATKHLVPEEKKAGVVFPNFPWPPPPEKKEEGIEKTVTVTGLVLNSYLRKARPIPGKSREFKQSSHVAFEPVKRASKRKEVQLVPSASQESQHIQKI